jgi:hypothetical protein
MFTFDDDAVAGIMFADGGFFADSVAAFTAAVSLFNDGPALAGGGEGNRQCGQNQGHEQVFHYESPNEVPQPACANATQHASAERNGLAKEEAQGPASEQRFEQAGHGGLRH